MKYLSCVAFLSIICGTFVGTSAGTPASAGGLRGDVQPFIGFWQGVDLVDGSSIQVSISDSDRDGELDVRYREGQFSVCLSASDTQGRGLYTGPASVDGRDMIVIEGALVCINDDNTQEAPQPTQLSARLDRANDILIFAPEVGEPNILHRTSW